MDHLPFPTLVLEDQVSLWPELQVIFTLTAAPEDRNKIRLQCQIHEYNLYSSTPSPPTGSQIGFIKMVIYLFYSNLTYFTYFYWFCNQIIPSGGQWAGQCGV